MELSRQEYWSGLSFPSPRYLPDSGVEPGSPALQADSLPFEPLGKPMINMYVKHLEASRNISPKAHYSVKMESDRRKGRLRMRWLDDVTDSMA